MAFPTLARRLHRSHLQLFSPLILSQHSTSPTLSQPPCHHLSQAFHRTPLFTSPSSRSRPHFSTLKQNRCAPIDFTAKAFENHDLQDPGLLLLLKTLEHVAHLPTEAEAVSSLEELGVAARPELVRSAIWVLREEWRLAFLAFKWGEKWGCCDEEAWSLMVWVLGSHGKFNTAWCLIRDLHRSSMDTRRAMLIMIDRYASANDPDKAIWAFHFMEKFSLTPDQEAFYNTLNALCKHGYIEKAEEFLLANKKLFPLETRGFNIILNGWCNISVDVSEAKRVWREMPKCCVVPDATSYAHMISCFSKVGNLFDSLRLHDEMKKRGWLPGVNVYNSLIFVLSQENCFKEALKFLEKIRESGLQPDSTTYNSMISPLCKARKLDEARTVLATMLGENIRPTAETYHAFLGTAELEETLEVLSRMKKAELGPSEETFLMILEKFFKLEQPENALKIWAEMKRYEVVPDSTHYTKMVQGLAACGFLLKAREFLAAMRSDGFLVDPKLKILVKETVRDSTSSKSERQFRLLKGGKKVNRRKSR